MKKKPNKNKLIKKADKLWAELIRSKGHCEVCGKRECLNAHHIISRSSKDLRHQPRNGVCLCAGHHTLCQQSAHKDPLWFYEWLEKYRKKDLDFLKEERKKPPKSLDLKHYLQIIEIINKTLDKKKK